MTSKAYIVLVECRTCGRKQAQIYTFPDEEILPFGRSCGCVNPKFWLDSGYTPAQWFAKMRSERMHNKYII